MGVSSADSLIMGAILEVPDRAWSLALLLKRTSFPN